MRAVTPCEAPPARKIEPRLLGFGMMQYVCIKARLVHNADELGVGRVTVVDETARL